MNQEMGEEKSVGRPDRNRWWRQKDPAQGDDDRSKPAALKLSKVASFSH